MPLKILNNILKDYKTNESLIIYIIIICRITTAHFDARNNATDLVKAFSVEL